MKIILFVLSFFMMSLAYAEEHNRFSGVGYASCMTIVKEEARLAENCQGLNKPGWESTYATCMESTFQNAVPYSDRGSLTLREYPALHRYCLNMVTPPTSTSTTNCDVVTDAYVFCRGNKYVREGAK
jgi:hypothetical protein